MNADSVKARLKKYAVESGHTFQEALTYYGLERTIYRISVSRHAEHFVLKGGIFLYAIFDRNYGRSTTDVDLLARRISNSSIEMKEVFREIFAQDIDDALTFDVESVSVEDITEFKEYHGLHVSAVGYLDRTRIPVSIDIGFGDVIYPDAVKMDFPVILDMKAPRVNAYSLESSIAEKIEAIIHNGYLNSRYKDFYDIYILTGKYSFDFRDMKSAVIETFQNRGTLMSMSTAAFGDEFVQDSLHRTRWNAFLKKKKALVQISLEETILGVKTFAEPLLEDTNTDACKWNPENRVWEC